MALRVHDENRECDLRIVAGRGCHEPVVNALRVLTFERAGLGGYGDIGENRRASIHEGSPRCADSGRALHHVKDGARGVGVHETSKRFRTLLIQYRAALRYDGIDKRWPQHNALVCDPADNRGGMNRAEGNIAESSGGATHLKFIIRNFRGTWGEG